MLANCTSVSTGTARDVIAGEQITVTATLTGTGALSATYRIQTSHDGSNWATFRTSTMTGSTSVTEKLVFSAPTWRIRGVCDAISGTNASLDVYARATDPVTRTVATLRPAAVAGAGARAVVTDLDTPVLTHTATGGGAVVGPVYSDGTSWLVG